MSRGRLVAPASALLLGLTGALVLASPALAVPGTFGDYFYGPKLVRAEVLLKDNELHDYRIDRGRIRQIAPGSLTLLEKDGSLQTVAVDPAARVLVKGAPSSFSALHRGMTVTTIRDGSAAAQEVRATSAGALGNRFFGPKLVRAEVLVKDGGDRDYRIDRGRIRQVVPGSLTLLEKDGTMVTIAVSATARVTLNGSPSSFTALRKGMTATTIREGSAAAEDVRATPR